MIFVSLPVPRSLAVTFRMPLASMSKVTSICGTPLGAGGKSTRLNSPSETLSAAIARSPWNTWMVTAVWKSAAVVKTWLRLVGMVVFLSMTFVMTPPMVSTPKRKWGNVEEQ